MSNQLATWKAIEDKLSYVFVPTDLEQKLPSKATIIANDTDNKIAIAGSYADDQLVLIDDISSAASTEIEFLVWIEPASLPFTSTGQFEILYGDYATGGLDYEFYGAGGTAGVQQIGVVYSYYKMHFNTGMVELGGTNDQFTFPRSVFSKITHIRLRFMPAQTNVFSYFEVTPVTVFIDYMPSAGSIVGPTEVSYMTKYMPDTLHSNFLADFTNQQVNTLSMFVAGNQLKFAIA